MKRFKKKPVTIEAAMWLGKNSRDAKEFCRANMMPNFSMGEIEGKKGLLIPTLEGGHIAERGDWIIKGGAGEYYPCRNWIFEQTYESEAE